MRACLLFLLWLSCAGCTLERGGICRPDPPYNCGLGFDSGPDAFIMADAQAQDAELDAGLDSALPVDASVDSGPLDSGPEDSGPVDSGPPDTGPPDSGPPDSGPLDSGPVDSGLDAGPVSCETYSGICIRFTNNPGNPPVLSYWSRVRGATGTIAGADWASRCVDGVRVISTRITECFLDLPEATSGRELWFYPSYDATGGTPVFISGTGPVSGYDIWINGSGFPDASLRARQAIVGERPPAVDSFVVVLTVP